MADDTLKPMTDKDVVPAAADPMGSTDAFQSQNSQKDADGGSSADDSAGSTASGQPMRQVINDNVAKLKGDAGDRVRMFADQGKEKATGALEQLAQMLAEAASQVDEKLGAQYGQYARSAADQVQGLSSSLNERSVDELLNDARELVRRSPGAAIGAAAAVGFVLSRVLSSGLDQRDQG